MVRFQICYFKLCEKNNISNIFTILLRFLDLTPLPVVTHNQSSKSKENSNSSQSSEEIVIVSPNKKRSNASKRTPRSERKNIASSSQKNTPSTSQNNTQECPICREYFPKDKIQVSVY